MSTSKKRRFSIKIYSVLAMVMISQFNTLASRGWALTRLSSTRMFIISAVSHGLGNTAHWDCNSNRLGQLNSTFK